MNKITQKLCDQVGIDVAYLTNTKQIVLIEELVKQVAEQCALLCGSQADKKIIRTAFDIPVEPDVKYEIFGNSVLLKLFNSTFIVFRNGRQFKA